MKRALLIGSHPILKSIQAQYEALGCDIEIADRFDALKGHVDFNELCVFPQNSIADHDTLEMLETFATSYPDIPEGQSRPLCHLMLHDKITLWRLQTLNLYPEIQNKFDLYAFTIEDQWAKNVFCGLRVNHALYPPLDREKIDESSNKTVHLVIAGFSNLGESLAIHAALITHFPNYVRNQSLRTHITIVDKNLTDRKDAFIQRYANLFDHSYYRCIDLCQCNMTQQHDPIYHSTRQDFVDVEWEFVEGDFNDPLMQRKLQLWGDDKDQLLTLALCDDDSNNNFHRALALPKNIFQGNITVLVRAESSGMLGKMPEAEKYRNLYPIGMNDCGYDIRLPLLQMAKRLNYFYTYSYGKKGIPTEMPVEKVEAAWRKIKIFSLRYSSLYNVMTLATKMRSLGHEEKDWDKFYALTPEEIATLSAVEHNRWSVERLILGFRPPTDTEREEIHKNIGLKETYKKKKIHYDLCAYSELGVDATGQDVSLYDYDLISCTPLIAQPFKEFQVSN